MEKDKIFFGENGLTSTSANYIANIAKEAYSTTMTALNSAVFYTTEVSLLGTNSPNTLKEGVDDKFLDDINDSLHAVAQLKSLIAWLREAIKAKEILIKEAASLKDEEIAEILGINLPKSAESFKRLIADDVIATWNIKQRNRYYYLETLCSTIGKYIHPDMGFSNAKEALEKVLTEKHTINGTGRDAVIYTRIPTVSIDKVNEVFFALQDKYRSYQAELNSMKHSIEVALQEDDREKSQKELESAKNTQSEWNVVLSTITTYRKEAIKEAQALKIVIPDSLVHIYNVVAELGKQAAKV